ncbi:diguanylate cyclase (GGDEF)-like protein [Duganella sp. SG902]|uniref:EAL domain-containing protein n=1 Tax=Duganella sp. SG902 TaxID=2587016 RepID=UPI00159DE09B|nr:EAL domain-containing protein [Duganella sp. SG902]NVM77889.1 diguanylate cyclase (GGDEF)-like protein [Duganella sp. SG902]
MTAPILIIDDEPANLATLRAILGEDHPLAFARNGAEGLAAARKHHPVLILLDVQMPDMDGYAVCRQLKAQPDTCDIPVIFVSAMSEVGDEAAGFACGAVDYIVKPVSPALVRARVRTHMSLVNANQLAHYVRELESHQLKIARLSRIKSVLSGINSAVIRIRNRAALYHEACRVAAEDGGFDTAWIALRDGAGMKAVAWRGSTPERLEQLLEAMAREPDDERSAPRRALAHARAACCNDLSDPAQTGAACADARAHGFLSLIALPLMLGPAAAGVMVFYARDAGYFDAEELALLDGLAGDISFAMEYIAQEERVNYLSYYDAVTGLPNQALFQDRLGQIIQSGRHEGGHAFVFMLNLDRFKRLNDALGSRAGDEVLRIVAQRLLDGLNRPCTVARLAGDIFVIAGACGAGEDLLPLIGHAAELIGQVIQLDGNEVHLTVHGGIASYPRDGADAEALFRHAEAALKQAKAGGERLSFYSSEMNANMLAKLELENMLRSACEQRQFVLHFQPKVDLHSGRIAAAEALIRWVHPGRGMVSPAEFIPLAEQTGLILEIGAWVIASVCAQQAAWLAAGVPVVPVALNLSALQFGHGDLAAQVANGLARHGLGSDLIELELTESLVMHDPASAERTMRQLRGMGLHLSLDDFGTGYSSLAHLKRFPFNSVKIDRAFVTDLTSNPDDAAIASAIIAMSHNLRMLVIAEGVETAAQLEQLRAKGCDQIQGYYFSPPVAAEAFAAMLRADRHIDLPATADTQERTLLVVDHEPARAAAVQRALRSEGYRILAASNVDEALEALARTPVQVILCEHRLPDVPGPRLLAIASRLYPDTMRLLLSDHDGLAPVLDAVNSGEIYRFLTRPCDDAQLRLALRDAFRRHQPSPP